eukprot:g72961.t1
MSLPSFAWLLLSLPAVLSTPAKHGFLDPLLVGGFRGGLGAWMLVRYSASDVGPYDELLFIPGDFEHRTAPRPRHRFKSITSIYVSTNVSVTEGVINWAIPKQLAVFKWTARSDGCTCVEVSTADAHKFFHADISAPWSRLSLPTSSAWAPFSFSNLLHRSADGHYLATSLNGTGRVRIARLLHLKVDERFFPDLDKAGGLSTGVFVDTFKMTFDSPTRMDGGMTTIF